MQQVHERGKTFSALICIMFTNRTLKRPVAFLNLSQKKYKEDGKRKASVSLYSQLPDTPEIQHAVEVSQLQSEVQTHTRTQILGRSSTLCVCLFQVNYRPKLQVKRAPSSLYSQLADTAEIQFAREMTEMQSEVGHSRNIHLHKRR